MSELAGPGHEFDPESVAGASVKVLVVRPSRRSRLAAIVPPTLVLLLAVALTAEQFRRRGPGSQPLELVIATPRHPAVPTPAIDEGEVRVAEVPPAVLPVGEVVDPPSPVAPVLEQTPVPATPVDQAVEVAAGASEPPPTPPAERAMAEIVWDDIQAEADAARRELEDSQAVRGEAFAARQQTQIERLEAARINAVADRPTFHNDLRTLLGRHGRRAGGYIAELVTVYGREVEPEIYEQAEALRVRLANANVPPAESVLAFRRIGLPEPSILSELAQRLQPTIGSRRGPRNGQEVLYFAAKMLIGVPPEGEL